MDALDVIKRRRSTRRYTTQQVPDAIVETCLEAGAYAPFAQEGSRHFTVIQNKAVLDKINAEAKRTATQFGIPHLATLGSDPAFHCFWNAPTAILLSGNKNTASPEMDCAAAAQNILLAAEASGLGACWVFFPLLAFQGGNAGLLANEIKLPDGFMPAVAIALGYKDGDTTVDSLNRKAAFTMID